jgi:hypothetical protein
VSTEGLKQIPSNKLTLPRLRAPHSLSRTQTAFLGLNQTQRSEYRSVLGIKHENKHPTINTSAELLPPQLKDGFRQKTFSSGNSNQERVKTGSSTGNEGRKKPGGRGRTLDVFQKACRRCKQGDIVAGQWGISVLFCKFVR